MKYCLVFLILSSCVPIGRESNIFIDPVLRPYYISFINESEKQGVSIKQRDFEMEFGDTKGALGNCQFFISLSIIHIDRASWEYLSDYEKEEVTYHEMGHCLLGRGHRTGLIEMNNEEIPISIMNMYLFDGSFLKRYHDYYMQELFR